MNTKIENAAAVESFTLLDADKVKVIKGLIGGDRSTVDSLAKAETIIAEATAKTEGLYGLPVLMGPIADDSAPVTIATLGTRQNKVNGIKAVIVMQIPPVSAFIESEAAFVEKLIIREAADAMFSELRNATTYAELISAAERIPSTASAIASESRQGGGSITAAFDGFWPLYSAYLKEKNPALHAALPGKNIVVKALRSKSYALANPLTTVLEQGGAFAKVLASMIKVGDAGATDPQGQKVEFDTSSYAEWLETRDTVELTYSEPKAKEISAAAMALDF